ncbi:MAG: shikimate dehydrogenase [Akkermansia sp.]
MNKDYFTLSDLKDRHLIDEGDERLAKLAVIGCPIAHSKSPSMQQAALDVAGVPMRYIRVEAQPGEFSLVVNRLCELGFIGANVTVPYKCEAAALCEDVDALSRLTGASNTLVFPRDGMGMMGFNTDGPGFVRAIRECFAVDVRDLKIVLLGATGGAGMALAHTCALNVCERLVLVGRDEGKLDALRCRLVSSFVDERRLEGAADRLMSVSFDSSHLAEVIDDADLIVNATSLGLKPTDLSPIPASMISPHLLVYDLMTHSDAFQIDAVSRGSRVANGRSMLLHQGALSFERWLGKAPDLVAMRSALGMS